MYTRSKNMHRDNPLSIHFKMKSNFVRPIEIAQIDQRLWNGDTFFEMVS